MGEWIVGRWLTNNVPEPRYRQDFDKKWSIVSGFAVITFHASAIGQVGLEVQGFFEEVFTGDSFEINTCREFAVFKREHKIVSLNDDAVQITMVPIEAKAVDWACGRGLGVGLTLTGMQYRRTEDGMVLEDLNRVARNRYRRIHI